MKKSVIRKIYIGIFAGMLSIPTVCMTFYKTDMSAEKRIATRMPNVLTESGRINTTFFNELDGYYNDHFAFRQEMATLDEVLTTKLAFTSNNDNVIYGKKGWLYYGETLNEYRGVGVLSDRAIFNAATSIRLMQEYCESLGCKFVFTVAPVKASLYPEYLPDNIIKVSSVNNLSKLVNAMDKQKINYVNLHDLFAKDDRILYHKWDTHWNNEGAALAMKYLQDACGRDYTDYENEKYSITKDFKGDLYTMLYPKGKALDENVTYEKQHEFVYDDAFKSVEDNKIQATCSNKDGSLVMYRDSYGNALIPFMADEYEKSYFTKIVPYNMLEVKDKEANVVMAEITQRHISYLTRYAPVMPAAIYEDLPSEIETVKKNDTAKVSEENGMILITGSVDEKYVDSDSRIFVRVMDSEYITDYEATPVANTLNNNGRVSDYNFTVYLDKSFLIEGKNDVCIITEKDGKYISSEVITNFDI